MGYPREAMVKLLMPAFLPFNLLKGGLNTAVTLLLYKPVVTALRRAQLVGESRGTEKSRTNTGIVIVSCLVIVTCILIVLSLNGVI